MCFLFSGLDPASFLFERFSEDVRLDKTDAYFVDVIHTNANFLGKYVKAM